MIIVVESPSVSVQDADDLAHLKVVSPLHTLAEIDIALRRAALGHADSAIAANEVLVNIAELRRRASAVSSRKDWNDAWNAMVAGARKAGWVDAAGATVRAHVEHVK